LPRIDAARVDLVPLAFALAISIAVAVLFGLAPAIQAVRDGKQQALHDGGTRAGTTRSTTRTRRTLVSVELALSVVLLVGAGLALRSIMRLQRVDPGFDRHNVVTASISLPGIRYPTRAKAIAFMYGLRDRLAATPGVEAVGISTASPLGGGGFYLG